MRLAVVVPTYDRPAPLSEALESVAAQTRSPEEVWVVIDGGPPRPELEVLRAALPLQVLRLPENRGQAAARNAALARTDADAVAFLDDDDLYLPRHLERLERALRDDPTLALVYDDAEVRRDDGATRAIAREYDPALMRTHDYLPPACWLARRDALARAAGFDETLRCYEDWDLLLRLGAWGGIRRVPGPGAVVRLAGAASERGAVRDHGNQSRWVDAARLDALARFRAKHDLGAIEPMTFWEVARIVAPGAPGPR